jgi:hypothetical protein
MLPRHIVLLVATLIAPSIAGCGTDTKTVTDHLPATTVVTTATTPAATVPTTAVDPRHKTTAADEILAVAAKESAAIQAKDYDTICRLLDTKARDQLMAIKGLPCSEAVANLSGTTTKPIRLTHIKIHGDKATAFDVNSGTVATYVRAGNGKWYIAASN